MATYTINNKRIIPNSWTEPCMNCFAQVTYTKDEVMEDALRQTKWINCPHCRKIMAVHFQNIQLC